MPNEQNIGYSFTTEKLLDPRRQQYRDKELPTRTVHIFERNKQGGTAIDASLGEVRLGSIAFSGSNYDLAPGSYSLRIIRRTISIGSMATNGQLWWYLRHSREGTVDAIGFRTNTYSPWVHVADPQAPLYSLGPGTISIYMKSLKGTHRVASNLEGVF